MASALEDPLVDRAFVDPRPIVADHTTLRALVERIGQVLAGLVARDPSGESEMLGLVQEFRSLVLVHFELEERSGVLEKAAEHEPRFAGRVDALLRDHRRMRRVVVELCDEAPGPSWVDFEVRFGAFCDILGVHEQLENELLMSAYLDDLGGHN